MRCVLADRGGCGGRLDPHHLIPRRTLKEQLSWWHSLLASRRLEVGLPIDIPLEAVALADERNIVPLCRTHHERVENKRIYLDEFPEGLEAFAASLGLSWYVDEFLVGGARR